MVSASLILLKRHKTQTVAFNKKLIYKIKPQQRNTVSAFHITSVHTLLSAVAQGTAASTEEGEEVRIPRATEHEHESEEEKKRERVAGVTGLRMATDRSSLEKPEARRGKAGRPQQSLNVAWTSIDRYFGPRAEAGESDPRFHNCSQTLESNKHVLSVLALELIIWWKVRNRAPRQLRPSLLADRGTF
ncbi:Uncharacterized protein DAT39_001687 [Clarias magur]|uniref:Uncharacterized protein n=1 Tax=Clarias magur TaxID=1594786 RepID=A0A8J4U7Z8_CLAMG|nr:Uncharacterized protein DAT39_001687 [Clarias magur]